MVAAAVARQAAAVVHARALAALARAALVDDDEGDAFGCVRLLLTELAAALHVEPGRQGQQGAGAGQGLPRTRRRRAQRRAALARLASSGTAHGGVVVAGCEHGNKDMKKMALVKKHPQAQRLAAGKRLATGDAIIEAKEYGAIGDAGADTGVSKILAESAGAAPQCQQLLLMQQAQQAAAPAAAPAPTEMAQMKTMQIDEQPTSAAPRVAVAAEPHKRRAVAAGTAVGEVVGVVGGKPQACDEGEWTTVTTRRARRQERARIDGTTSSAARKAAAARTAATRRTAAAIIEYIGKGE